MVQVVQLPAFVKTSSSRCKICQVRKSGCTDFCRYHKHAIRRALRLVSDEKLLVDEAGLAWWVWSSIGEVLALGDTRLEALVALDEGMEWA